MPMRPLPLVATLVCCLAVAACTPFASAPPATSPSSELTPTAAAPSNRPASSASERSWPDLRGEPGGTMRLNGAHIGRDGPESLEALIAAMGPADESRPGTCTVENLVFRWGDLAVTVLLAQDSENEYGFSYPVGAISGWRIDPTLDGKKGLEPPVAGPDGVTIGTPLATLQTQFTMAEWDYAGGETINGMRTFGIFSGDTVGASFELDEQDHVSAMASGYQCLAAPGR